MTNILEKIVKDKVIHVEKCKSRVKESQLYCQPQFGRTCISLNECTKTLPHPWVISEFKRKSPSKPDIALDAQIEEVVPHYAQSGASALSILTDTPYFGGNDEDLIKARALVDIPILRKEFIIDPYQIIEAKALGADFILLIAEILTKSQVKEFSLLANELGLEVLLELHSEDQIEKYHDSVQFIGINNRDLTRFVTDIETSLRIFPKLPAHPIKISESGIKSVEDIKVLTGVGYSGYLIGEHLMATNDKQSVQFFISQLKDIPCT